MLYRKAVEEDLMQLSEMRWDFRFEHDDPDPALSKQEFIMDCTSFLKERLKTGEWTFWIAEENGLIVSHIFIIKITKVPKPGRLFRQYGYVTNVYTRPNYRNKGIGSRLLEHVKEWAKDEDLELLIVWPSEQSTNYYEKAGFSTHNDVMEYTIKRY